MTAYSFMTATEILFGRGTAQAVIARACACADRILVVHGADTGRAAWLIEALHKAGPDVATFSCPGEPDLDLILAGLALARSHQADLVISLGGGAAIDTGKAIAALAPAQRPPLDHLEVVGKGLALDAAPLPFYAIPTTAGTGAEVTRNAVIGVPAHRRKVSLRDPRMVPDLAVVDPALTDDTPRSVTLASGLDAITQVIEPYVSSKANPLTDALCRAAIPMGLSALRALMDGENRDARDHMAQVSLCGGLALANAGLGAVHGLAGPIGGMAPAPHGAVCGTLLPQVLTANTDRATGPAADRLADVAKWIANAYGVLLNDAVDTLGTWAQDHGLPGLEQMGVLHKDLGTIAGAATSSSSMKGNPVPLSKQDLTDILRAAY